MESGWVGVWQLPKVNLPQSCTDLEVMGEILFTSSIHCVLVVMKVLASYSSTKKGKKKKPKVQLPTGAKIARKAPYVKKQSNLVLLDLFPNLDQLHSFLLPAFFPELSPQECSGLVFVLFRDQTTSSCDCHWKLFKFRPRRVLSIQECCQ